MIELSKFDFNGLKPLDESLLSEADMLEVLGGQDTVYVIKVTVRSICKLIINV